MAENEEPDEDGEDEPEPFGGEEALELARQGKDAWNAWAEDNPGRKVDFSAIDLTTEENEEISFGGFTFPGEALFSETKFQSADFNEAIFIGNADFSGATIEDYGWFQGSVFIGKAEFIGTLCKDAAFFLDALFEEDALFISFFFVNDANFQNATFQKNAIFIGATFTGPFVLDGSRFRVVPDFRLSEFNKHVTLHGMRVDFRRPTNSADVDQVPATEGICHRRPRPRP
jgi:hypothetical protein